MGLDQYGYARPPRKRNSEDDVQIGEWRKHNRLQGWMQQLWESKGCPNAKMKMVILIVLSCNLPKKIFMLLRMTFLQFEYARS